MFQSQSLKLVGLLASITMSLPLLPFVVDAQAVGPSGTGGADDAGLTLSSPPDFRAFAASSTESMDPSTPTVSRKQSSSSGIDEIATDCAAAPESAPSIKASIARDGAPQQGPCDSKRCHYRGCGISVKY